VRFREVRYGGERPFVLDLHPRLTLLTGLGHSGRRWMAALLQRALQGDLHDVDGTVEVHGVERRLDDALVAELGLPADLDVLVRAADLPGARSVVAATDAEPTAADAADADADLPDLRALADELAQARHAHTRAAENRAHTERLLEGSRLALAPEAADVAAAEATLDAARRRRDLAATRLETLVQAAPDDERHRRAGVRAALFERKATLEDRRHAVMETLERDATSAVDPGGVAAALARRRDWVGAEPRAVPEAVDLAEELDRVEAELASMPTPPPTAPALVADAERALDGARRAFAEAEAALAQRQVSPEDAARIDAVHADVLDAEEKAERRLSSPRAKTRYKDAREGERRVLDELGFSSYSDYLLSTATLVVDPAAPRRLIDARRRLDAAEAVWDEVMGASIRAERARVEERHVTLLKRARDLLGALPEGDVASALRDLRATPVGPDDAALVDALRGVGIDVDPAAVDVVALAEQFLADADEAHARRAALQAELSSVADDLADVQRELAALPPPEEHTIATDELDDARRELQRAQEDEQRAHRDVVAARAAAAEHRAAIQRIEALEADLAGAFAAEQQAGAHVAEIEAATADAEAQHEHRRRDRREAAERADATVDVRDVERIPTEVYLLARIAGQREVGQAGSVPLVIADALDGLSVDTTQGVLHVIERFAPVVQVVLMSDDPAIDEWARSFGPDGAAVRRFSNVSAST
jgi:chromosome segregation ATPase